MRFEQKLETYCDNMFYGKLPRMNCFIEKGKCLNDKQAKIELIKSLK